MERSITDCSEDGGLPDRADVCATHREVVQGNARVRQEMCKAIIAVTSLGAGFQTGSTICKITLHTPSSFPTPNIILPTVHSHSFSVVSPFKHRIKSHLLFAGIIRSSPFSPR